MKAKQEQMNISGLVEYVHKNSEGKILRKFTKSNLVPTVGKAEVAKLVIATGAAADNIAIGTGTTNFAATSTQLTNEYKRDTATTSNVTVSVAGDTAQLVNTFSITETKAITESGVLNAATTGELFAAQTFSAINVANGDSLQVTWKLTIST